MIRLYLIRKTATLDCWDCFETKTEVWLFGNRDGYSLLCEKLLEANASDVNVHLTTLDRHGNSMTCVILPAQKDTRRSPRLKFIKRAVYIKRKLRMELVICGNGKGYSFLCATIETLMKKATSDPSDYIKLDDWTDARIVRRSLSLNIRAPLAHWSLLALGPYSTLVCPKKDNILPTEILYRAGEMHPYEEIESRHSIYCRL